MSSASASSAAAAAPSAPAWKIERRGASCGNCGKPFEEGAGLYSAIAIDEGSGQLPVSLRRFDRCAECHRGRAKIPNEILWKTKFHAQPKKAKLDLAALADVFRQLAASADARLRDLRYLVTLLLLRHRKLRVARTRSEEHQDYLVVAFGRAKQTFDVEVSDLSADRLEGLRERLVAIFEGRDPAAEPAAASPPAPPEEPAPAANGGGTKS